jgi:predicted dienelactone hydrolase
VKFCLAVVLEDGQASYEEGSGGDGHEEDGVTVGCLGFGWGGGGVVETLGAALRVGWRCGGEGYEDEGCQEKVPGCASFA